MSGISGISGYNADPYAAYKTTAAKQDVAAKNLRRS